MGELELEQLQEKEMLQQQERVAAEQQIAAFLRQQEQVERQMDAIAAEQRELRAQEQTMREALQQQRMAELRQQELLEEHLRWQQQQQQQQQQQLQQLLLLQQQQQQPSPPLPQLVTPFSALDAHTASVCVPQVSSDLYRTAGLGSVGFAGGYPLGAGSADVVNRAGSYPYRSRQRLEWARWALRATLRHQRRRTRRRHLTNSLQRTCSNSSGSSSSSSNSSSSFNSNSNKRLVAAEELLIEAQVNLRCLRWPVPEARRSPVFSHSMPTRQARSDPWMVALTAQAGRHLQYLPCSVCHPGCARMWFIFACHANEA